MDITELHVFDFDGTTFKSPLPPPGWGNKSVWFGTLGSLDEPCVPTFPPVTWWITSTLQAAKRSISSRGVYAIMATGRKEHIFKDRLDELLHHKGLEGFDEIHLKPHGKTIDYKLELMDRILDENPSITRVEIWEDRIQHLTRFRSHLTSRGYDVKTHLVRVEPMRARCTLPSPKRVASLYRAK